MHALQHSSIFSLPCFHSCEPCHNATFVSLCSSAYCFSSQNLVYRTTEPQNQLYRTTEPVSEPSTSPSVSLFLFVFFSVSLLSMPGPGQGKQGQKKKWHENMHPKADIAAVNTIVNIGTLTARTDLLTNETAPPTTIANTAANNANDQQHDKCRCQYGRVIPSQPDT